MRNSLFEQLLSELRRRNVLRVAALHLVNARFIELCERVRAPESSGDIAPPPGVAPE